MSKKEDTSEHKYASIGSANAQDNSIDTEIEDKKQIKKKKFLRNRITFNLLLCHSQ